MLRNIDKHANVHVVTNGVDTDYFAPRGVPAAAPVIAFTGDMGYFPNASAVIAFANEALPLIRQSVPDATFLIVGRNPGPEVKQLERLPGVIVTGAGAGRRQLTVVG